MICTIWQRYFLKEILKTIFLFLFIFFGFYVLIDYSINAHLFSRLGFSYSTLLYYYFCEFSIRLDILLPFAILIATVRTLCDLTLHQELIALLASGIPLRKLLRPFLLIGFLGTFLIYINGEFILPQSIHGLKTLSTGRSFDQKNPHKKTAVHQLTLPNKTSLLYLDYDPTDMSFHQTYWIPKFDEVYHARTLYPFEKVPRGEHVTLFKRNSQGLLVEKITFPEFSFTQMTFDPETIWNTLKLPEEEAFSALFKTVPRVPFLMDEKQSQVATAFLNKLLVPWLSLLVVLAVAPYCVFFTRRLPLFLIYASSIFGLIATLLVLSAISVMSARQLISPFIAISSLFLLLFGIFLWNYKTKIV